MSEKRNLDYEKDERVLCYHGPLLYEAKVSQVSINTPLRPNMAIDTQDCANTMIDCPSGVKRRSTHVLCSLQGLEADVCFLSIHIDLGNTLAIILLHPTRYTRTLSLSLYLSTLSMGYLDS